MFICSRNTQSSTDDATHTNNSTREVRDNVMKTTKHRIKRHHWKRKRFTTINKTLKGHHTTTTEAKVRDL